MARARYGGDGSKKATSGDAKSPIQKNGSDGPLAGALGAVYLFGLLGAEEEAAWISGWEPIVLGEQPEQDIG
jgi:hypothetical protein